ncbi:MAG: hypothetical protein PUI46_01270 [Lachnospiraceae bacterium]|nr:hypothetical protein [Lachnospiraceae bacterium]
MGKRKKACTQPPRWGWIHAYVTVCGHKKRADTDRRISPAAIPAL